MSVYSRGDKDRDSRDEKPKKDEDVGKKIEKGLADASKAVGKLFSGIGDSLGGKEKKWEKKGGGQRLGGGSDVASERQSSGVARPESRGGSSSTAGAPPQTTSCPAAPAPSNAPRADAAALAAAAEARASKKQPAKISAARRQAALANASSPQPPRPPSPPPPSDGSFDPTRAQFTSLAAPRSVHDVEAAVSAEARSAAEKEERWRQAGADPSPTADPTVVDQLVAMGFDRDASTHALVAAAGSVDGAVELLSSQHEASHGADGSAGDVGGGGASRTNVASAAPSAPIAQRDAPAPPAPASSPGPPQVEPSAADARAAVDELCAAAAAGAPAVATGLALLHRVLGNLASNPSEPKYRRLRRTNAKIGEMLCASPQFERVLGACGFAADASGEFLDFPAPGGAHAAACVEVVRGTHRAVSSALVTTAGTPPAGAPAESRSAAVYVLDGSSLAAAATFDVPDEFFEMDSAEAKALLASSARQRQESSVLRTRAQREADSASKRRVYKRALIRVRFPDGYALQGTFGATEPVSAVFEFVAASLREPWHEFHLTRPAGSVERGKSLRLEQMTETIAAAELTPSYVLNFQLGDGSGAVAPFLTPDLISSAKPLSHSGSVATAPTQP